MTGSSNDFNRIGLSDGKKILNDPTKKIYYRWNSRQKREVIDIYEDNGNGRGIRFSTDGKIIGFLQPRKK
ncbi:hypothetical protein FAI41_04330 [Acetobacteraceae bacterium]|nr:hypothetical protein FAI41_04330 [Acetobacteraceae bacterium]